MKIERFPGRLEKQLVERPFVKKKGTMSYMAYALTSEQEAWMRRWFPEVENSILSKTSGMSLSTLHRFARQLGLKKSEKGMKGIMKRQGIAKKRTCERNGYYDSIRGKRPSEKCQEGAARMWEEIHEGVREHPMRVFKKNNPRRYKRLMKKRSENRKEMFRKELLRVKYGLERKTKLSRVVLCPYTKSQRSHRYNALRRGYVLMDPEADGERYHIYYDEETERSEKFEGNLKKDGFKVMEYVSH